MDACGVMKMLRNRSMGEAAQLRSYSKKSLNFRLPQKGEFYSKVYLIKAVVKEKAE